MRICILTSTLSLGGPTTLIRNVVKPLINFGNEVFVISEIGEIDSKIKEYFDNEKINYRLLSKRNGKFDIAFLKSLKSALRQINPDIIWCHTSGYFYSMLCGYNHKVPRVHTIHSLPIKDQNWLQRFFVRYGLKKNNLFLVGCCDFVANEATSLYKSNVVTIYNGTDLIEKAQKKTKNFTFAYVGRFVKMKRIDCIISAFSILSKENKSLRLVLAGDGTEKTNLEELILKHHIEKECKIIDSTLFDETFYSKINVLCLASEWEAFPMTIIEALSSSCPCVSTNVGGVSEIIKNDVNGYLIDEFSITELSDKMKKCLDSEAYDRLSKSAKKSSSDYSSYACASNYFNFFKGILNK